MNAQPTNTPTHTKKQNCNVDNYTAMIYIIVYYHYFATNVHIPYACQCFVYNNYCLLLHYFLWLSIKQLHFVFDATLSFTYTHRAPEIPDLTLRDRQWVETVFLFCLSLLYLSKVMIRVCPSKPKAAIHVKKKKKNPEHSDTSQEE